MICALDPLFPGLALRQRRPQSETPLFRAVPDRRRGAAGAEETAPRWNAPDHWVERDRDI
ncbi:hypothetical protein [Antarctobacter jejuensis]|uniref:hypothetical protein n=1 Tax=Antarctobacter jejuensis TaxID=1439938 RepID=UPI003FD58DDB